MASYSDLWHIFSNLSSFTGVTAEGISGWSSTSPHSNLTHETTDITYDITKSGDSSDKRRSKASNAELLTWCHETGEVF
jgi:hypothetical protein